MRRFFNWKRFRKPSTVDGILAEFHVKVKQLEEHKVTQSRKIALHSEAQAAARRLEREAEAEWTHAHAVLGKLQELLGV